MANPLQYSYLGVGDGQEGLACCDSWGRRVGHDWATELNWTELSRNSSITMFAFKCIYLQRFFYANKHMAYTHTHTHTHTHQQHICYCCLIGLWAVGLIPECVSESCLLKHRPTPCFWDWQSAFWVCSMVIWRIHWEPLTLIHISQNLCVSHYWIYTRSF